MNANDYSEYTVQISSEPSYYGSECTDDDARQIAEELSNLIRAEFPSIQTSVWREGMGSSRTTGPDDGVVDEINDWIENNWTKAL